MRPEINHHKIFTKKNNFHYKPHYKSHLNAHYKPHYKPHNQHHYRHHSEPHYRSTHHQHEHLHDHHHHHHMMNPHKHFHPRNLALVQTNKNHIKLDNDDNQHDKHVTKKERNLLFTTSWDANEKRFTQRQIFQQLIRKGNLNKN